MNQKQRLELTWVGKDEQPKLEPRILIEDPDKSYGDKSSDNMLIYGDNLIALKALEQDFVGKINCIFIDPPYNTGSAFKHYDDGLEHSLWLSLMRDRIVILSSLLSEVGTLWITIDDNEAHYLKVLCDEIFGRNNFVANVVWQKRTSPDIRATIGAGHDHILVFAKNLPSFKGAMNKIPKTPEQVAQYKNPDNDPRGVWVSADFTAQGFRPNQMYKIVTPGGAEYIPPPGRCWKNVKSTFLDLVSEGKIWFGRDGRGIPRRKTYLSETEGIATWTWWENTEVGHNQEAKKEIIALFGADNAFGTPKPERLIQRIIQITTKPGDIVLDSFAGSGTTGAVAHKMGRRWVMVELGEHCDTHIIPRLKKVIDGEDEGGITETADWKGGGGFRYYYLAPSLLKKDKYNNWIIDERYNPTMLAAAMAKQEGFIYNPDETLYWKQGRSTEKDFIFTTTGFVTVEHLTKIREEMKPDESLLICCKSFQEACVNRYPNITVKKIPNMLLGRCEFGKEDYSLNIVNMPVDADTDSEPTDTEVEDKPTKKEAKKKTEKATAKNQSDLFTNPK